MVKKSISKTELLAMVFKDTKTVELRYRVAKDGKLELLVTLVPKKGKGKTIEFPIKDLTVGTHPVFGIDIIEKGRLQKLKPKEVTIDVGILKLKW